MKTRRTPAKPDESGHSVGEPIPLFWKTEKRKVVDLVPYDQNPRTMTGKQAEDLRKSLERFGLVEIPVVDTRDRIIAGHQRLKIMVMLGRGEEEIDVRAPSRELTEKEFQEYNIRSNKNTGSWDFEALANFPFETSELIDWGFSGAEFFSAGNPDPEPTDTKSPPDKVSRQCLWQRNHPDKSKAQDLCKKNPGKVIILYVCPCEAEVKKHNHHFDYSRAFEVIVLCEKCHIAEHLRLHKLEQEANDARSKTHPF